MANKRPKPEEIVSKLPHHLLFSLGDELKGRSATCVSKANSESNVVIDGALVIGQCSASAPPLAESVLDVRTN